MNINKIAAGNLSIYTKETDFKKKTETQEATKAEAKNQSDTLQLSEEMLKLKPILERMKNDYYSDPKVLEEIARRVNYDLAKE
jgi:hypothetical protein